MKKETTHTLWRCVDSQDWHWGVSLTCDRKVEPVASWLARQNKKRVNSTRPSAVKTKGGFTHLRSNVDHQAFARPFCKHYYLFLMKICLVIGEIMTIKVKVRTASLPPDCMSINANKWRPRRSRLCFVRLDWMLTTAPTTEPMMFAESNIKLPPSQKWLGSCSCLQPTEYSWTVTPLTPWLVHQSHCENHKLPLVRVAARARLPAPYRHFLFQHPRSRSLVFPLLRTSNPARNLQFCPQHC